MVKNVRSVLVATLACTALSLAPAKAGAEESPAAPLSFSPSGSPAPFGSELRLDATALSRLVAPTSLIGSASAAAARRGAMQEIRLSSGAKTAIIVTAIVVGVLILVGVIAVGLPHRP